LKKLLLPEFAQGVVVDGFPRTKTQVDCIKMLKDKMLSLRAEFLNTPYGVYFRRPVFRVAVLFVDENESVDRQLKRGKMAQHHNEKTKESGIGIFTEERITDYNEETARNRYAVFRDHYSTLKELQKILSFYCSKYKSTHSTSERRYYERVYISEFFRTFCANS